MGLGHDGGKWDRDMTGESETGTRQERMRLRHDRGECPTYQCSELALGQQADEQLLHAILVVLQRRHVTANVSLIHVAMIGLIN